MTPEVIVVDSSAVAAILFGEEMAGPLVERLAASRERVMSVVNYLEVGTVLAGRRHGRDPDWVTPTRSSAWCSPHQFNMCNSVA